MGVVWYAARSGGLIRCRLRGCVMNTETTYRVGLIGTGRKGNGHARGYVANPRTELVAAADPDPSNLAIFLDIRRGIPFFRLLFGVWLEASCCSKAPS